MIDDAVPTHPFPPSVQVPLLHTAHAPPPPPLQYDDGELECTHQLFPCQAVQSQTVKLTHHVPAFHHPLHQLSHGSARFAPPPHPPIAVSELNVELLHDTHCIIFVVPPAPPAPTTTE